MIRKKYAFAAASLLISGALALPVGAAAAKTSAASESAPSTSSSSGAHRTMRHGGGSDHMAWVLLADLTGQSMQELTQKYPQKTPWQAAKQAGKLDALKKAYLERAAQRIHSMQADGKISEKDASALYKELAQRVARIDGEKVVTMGPLSARQPQKPQDK